LLYRTQLFFQKSYFFKGRLIFVIFSGEDCDKNKYLYTQISVLKHFVYMGGIYGGKDIRPISQKQDSLHGLINTILDKLPLGVFVKDAEDGFRYLYWNRFMEEITGIGTEEVEGHNDFELSFDAIMPAEERLGLDRDVMETGRTIEFSGKISDAYGIPKDIEVTKFPIALSNGKPLLLALWRDVTVRNKMENTLRRSQVLTKMALHSNDIRLCSIFVNPDSKRNYDDSVVQVNNWLPGKEDELVDISWPRFAARVHPDDRERHDEAFRKLCSGEISEMKIELRVKYPGMDHYHWRESSATVYERDERGRGL
jgi:PAS domain S-box